MVVYVWDGKYFQNFLRIQLNAWKIPDQVEFILAMDKALNFSAIGLDRGGGGIGLVQDIQRTSERLKHITRGYHFGENICVARDPDTGQEIMRETKMFGIQLIENKMKYKTVIYPSTCQTREDEYVNLTHENRAGQIVYSKLNDHIISADICANIALHDMLSGDSDDVVDLGVVLKPIVFR